MLIKIKQCDDGGEDIYQTIIVGSEEIHYITYDNSLRKPIFNIYFKGTNLDDIYTMDDILYMIQEIEFNHGMDNILKDK